MNSWADCVPGTSAERRSATRHGEHHRNARRLYAGHRDADAPPRRRLVAAARRADTFALPSFLDPPTYFQIADTQWRTIP